VPGCGRRRRELRPCRPDGRCPFSDERHAGRPPSALCIHRSISEGAYEVLALVAGNRYTLKLFQSGKRPGNERKTFSAKPHEVRHDWYLVDANQKILGRLAARSRCACAASTSPSTRLTSIPATTSSWSTRAKLRVTGAKSTGKVYYRHSSYPGGVYETTFAKMQQRFPGRVLQKGGQGDAAQGSARLPMIKKLKISLAASTSLGAAAEGTERNERP